MLQVRYPDWDRRQLIDHEKKLIGKKDRMTESILRIPVYVGAVVMIVLAINFAAFLVLGYTPGDMTILYIAITWESLALMAAGLTFTRVHDIPVYGPTGRFYEVVRHPPRLTAAITCIASGVVLLIVGLLSLS